MSGRNWWFPGRNSPEFHQNLKQSEAYSAGLLPAGPKTNTASQGVISSNLDAAFLVAAQTDRLSFSYSSVFVFAGGWWGPVPCCLPSPSFPTTPQPRYLARLTLSRAALERFGLVHVHKNNREDTSQVRGQKRRKKTPLQTVGGGAHQHGRDAYRLRGGRRSRCGCVVDRHHGAL